MKSKLLARYLAEFNAPWHEWRDPREEPGPWSTLMVVAAVVGLLVVITLRLGGY